jgi:hypothetical protein
MLPPNVSLSTMAAAGASMLGWREMVRRDAENVVLARTPIARKLAEQMIEEYAAGQARRVVRRLRLIRHRTVRSGRFLGAEGKAIVDP